MLLLLVVLVLVLVLVLALLLLLLLVLVWAAPKGQQQRANANALFYTFCGGPALNAFRRRPFRSVTHVLQEARRLADPMATHPGSGSGGRESQGLR